MCIAFLQSDIDLAFTALRLAGAESSIGNSPRAAEFVEKAVLGYKNVSNQLASISFEFDEERSELRERTQRLFEAIVDAEHHLRFL